MRNTRIYITASSSISALGSTPEETYTNCLENISHSKTVEFFGETYPVYALSDSTKKIFAERFQERRYRHVDRVTKLALFSSQHLRSQIHQLSGRIGVSIGSARGATESLEHLHQSFLAHPTHTVPPYSSPATTAGSISSAIASELGVTGPAISTSMTCATFLHSLLSAYGLLQSGLCDAFIVGGAEAPLTPFTIAQMKALRIYSPIVGDPYPCRPCELYESSRNTMTLGEGAATFLLQPESSLAVRGLKPTSTPKILGIGFSKETEISHTGMDPEGAGFKASMEMALLEANLNTVDCIVLHAPGTTLGDNAELQAIEQIFSPNVPYLYSTKHLTGHTFGASAALSLYLALLMMENDQYPMLPYPTIFSSRNPQKIRTCMINSAGFGGSIMSVIVGMGE